MNVGTTWSLSDAAKSASVHPKKFQRLAHTVAPLRNNDVKPRGSGAYCGFSRNRVLQIAITHRLQKNGVLLSEAANGAFQFSDIGQRGRDPGQCYAEGQTYLVIRPDGATVINSEDFDPAFSTLADFGDCLVALLLNKIVEEVDHSLKSLTPNRKTNNVY